MYLDYRKVLTASVLIVGMANLGFVSTHMASRKTAENKQSLDVKTTEHSALKGTDQIIELQHRVDLLTQRLQQLEQATKNQAPEKPIL